MFEALGHAIVKRRKRTLSIFILAVIVLGSIGSLAFSRLDSGGYSDLNSDSAKAFKYLEDTFKVKDPAIVFVIHSDKLVTDPEVIASAARLEAKVKSEPSAASVLSFGAPEVRQL